MKSFHKVGIYTRTPFILLTALTILFRLLDFTQINFQYVVFFRVQAWVTTIVCCLQFYMMGFFYEGGNYTRNPSSLMDVLTIFSLVEGFIWVSVWSAGLPLWMRARNITATSRLHFNLMGLFHEGEILA